MELFWSLLAVGLTAALGENVVFSRAFGHGILLDGSDPPRVILQRGLVVSLLSLLAALSGWLGRICSERLLHLSTLMRPPVCLIIYLALFLPFYFLCRHNNLAAKCPALHPRVALACSFVPLGTMLVLCFSTYALPQTLAYGIGVGAGYLLALLLHHTLNRQLQMNQVPASLQGAPIALVYFGLISLALFGIVGHQLAL